MRGERLIQLLTMIIAQTCFNVQASDKVRPCDHATLACHYRGGCSNALRQYQINCRTLIDGNVDGCDEKCRLSLIALLSTSQGEALSKCECGDDSCRKEKRRVQDCKDKIILQTKPGVQVGCTVATYICQANLQCNTALRYYDRNCIGMFRGQECTPRCMNSLNILKKQRGAAKLLNCRCEGEKMIECRQTKMNMRRLCLKETPFRTLVDTVKKGNSSRSARNLVLPPRSSTPGSTSSPATSTTSRSASGRPTAPPPQGDITLTNTNINNNTTFVFTCPEESLINYRKFYSLVQLLLTWIVFLVTFVKNLFVEIYLYIMDHIPVQYVRQQIEYLQRLHRNS